jgi:hypothetical protein
MKAKHKYILTLSTLALFVIYVFIGYFISTRSISKAMKVEGGGCSYTTCKIDSDCCPKDYKKGRCNLKTNQCYWPACGSVTPNYPNNDCVDDYCCDKEAGSQAGNCFTSIYSNNNKYLCAPK